MTRPGPGRRTAGRGGPADAAVPPVRVLIVDDDALVRAGLSMILGGLPDLTVVGEAADGSEVPAAVAAYAPDVVLMDIRMPRVDGLTATEALRAQPHPPEVLVLTTFDADEHVLRALRAGAGGFLLKDTPPAEIVHAVRRVAAGEATLSPTVTRQLIAHVTAAAPGPVGPDPRRERALRLLTGLSERERQVAVALGRGHTNAEIAARAVHERGDREGVRLPAADPTGPEQPGPGRPARARRRPRLTAGRAGVSAEDLLTAYRN